MYSVLIKLPKCVPKAHKAEFTSLWLVVDKCMVYVYVLKSKSKKFRYVGITKNVAKRLFEHNGLKNFSTKSFVPFELIYTETYPSYKEARKREKFFKSGQGRLFLDTLT